MHGGSKESHNLSLGACVSLSISLRYNPVGCHSGAAAGEHACIGVGVASLRDKLNQKVTERSNNGIAGSIWMWSWDGEEFSKKTFKTKRTERLGNVQTLLGSGALCPYVLLRFRLQTDFIQFSSKRVWSAYGLGGWARGQALAQVDWWWDTIRRLFGSLCFVNEFVDFWEGWAILKVAKKNRNREMAEKNLRLVGMGWLVKCVKQSDYAKCHYLIFLRLASCFLKNSNDGKLLLSEG